MPRRGNCITNFKIAAKTNYDRGDCEFILVMHEKSSIMNIEPICKEYCFIPNTTIKELLTSTKQYRVGTIDVIVIVAYQMGTQCTIEIKYGNMGNDKAIVSTYLSIILTPKQFNYVYSFLIRYSIFFAYF